MKFRFPNISLYEVYYLLKTYYFDSKNVKFDKKGKIINVTQEDGNSGCEFTIKQIGNNIVLEGYCGC